MSFDTSVSPTPWRTHVGVLGAYTIIALVFVWPLPTHLRTHFTASPAGDAGVYIWNQWVFQHELLDHRRLPYVTHTLFGGGRRANLSLHNYTTLQNLLALPLVRVLGVVTTFNVIYLLMMVWTAHATFLLARAVTGRVAESWLAGLLFAWSPVLISRGATHFSLVAAAPLALFLLQWLRAADHQRWTDALVIGATVWLAASTDVYYAVYCVLMAALFVLARLVTIERTPPQARVSAVRWAVDVLLLSLVGLIVALLISGGWRFTFLGRPAFMRSLYTPVLVLTVLALLRAGWHYRTAWRPITRGTVWAFARMAVGAGIVAAVLLSPVLYALTQRIVTGEYDAPRIFWRSSPPGEDVLAWLVPNPNHPWAPPAFARWLMARPNGYEENVASLSWVGLTLLAAAVWRGWRPPRRWLGLAVTFGLLALGPFLVIGGLHTHVPGPWAVLRYLPVVGLARTPTRFSVPAMLAFAVLCASALAWLGRAYPQRRRWLLVGVGGLLIAELLPAPRPLYSAAIPTIYRRVAAAPDDAVVLELPFGLRDGRSNVGDFSALSQYFQTAHGKVLMGGYLSRVPGRHMAEAQRDPVLNALILLSERRPLSSDQERWLIEQAPDLIARQHVRFVVIDRGRASDVLHEVATRALRLRLIDADGSFELYEPALGPG
jgi:hypothetical protein